MNRILKGHGTRRDVETAGLNFQRWLQESWNGQGMLALAYCVNALAEAWGDEWDQLPQRDTTAHVWLFTFTCPSRDNLDIEAHRYVQGVYRNGGPHEIARRIRILRGQPE